MGFGRKVFNDVDVPNFTIRVGLLLWLGQMCWNVDHVNGDLPTHSTISNKCTQILTSTAAE